MERAKALEASMIQNGTLGTCWEEEKEETIQTKTILA